MNNKKFIDWISSSAGCDGGNIKGPIWFFGLEWGGDYPAAHYKDRAPIIGHQEINEEYRKVFLVNTQFHTKLLKLYSSILGWDIQNFSKVFEDTKTFAYDSDCYKGNMYILSFPEEKDNLFLPEHQELTGCKTKTEYKQLHRDHRFPMLAKWTKEHKPKLILCFGISQAYIEDFYLAFSGKKHSTGDTALEIIADTNIRYGFLNDQKTLLVIAPFIGHYKYCLNSDERLRNVGKFIGELCRVSNSVRHLPRKQRSYLPVSFKKP